MLEHKILTWEILIKQGIIGPSRCVLCGNAEETLNHLFIYCNFKKSIWLSILKEQNINNIWEGGLLIDCFQNWSSKTNFWKEFPCYICWDIWKQRNLVMFEDLPISQIMVYNRILQDLGENKNKFSAQLDRITQPPLLD